MSIRINTLPGLRILAPSGEVSVLAGRRLPQALLVYLAVERSAPRDMLLALLWPDRDDERARHSLSQALHELRAHLGEDSLGGSGDVVTAGAAVETDLARFEAAVEGGRWAEALELYGGGFLEGVHLAPTHAFEEWLDRRRAQVARLHRRARRELVAQRLEAQDVAGALVVAERWAELAPLDDEAQMRAVQLLGRTGRRADALRQFERFRELLRVEELEPMPDLVQLAADIAAGRVESDPATPAPTAGAPEAGGPTAPGPRTASPPALPAASPVAADRGAASHPGDAAGVTAAPPSRPRFNGDLLTGGFVGVLVGAPCALLAAAVLHVLAPALAPPALPGNTVATAVALLFALGALVLLTRPLRARWRATRAGAIPGVARRPSRGLGAGLGFALGFLAALSLAYTLAPLPPPGTRAAPRGKGERRVPGVAITRFANRTGDPALEPIGRMAEDWVARRLRSIPEAVVVADAPATAADTSPAAVAALVRRTGAAAVVFGSYYREGSDVLLVARLLPAPGIRVPGADEMALQPIGPVRAPRDRPLAAVERLAAMVAGALAAQCRSPECAPGRRPPTYEARAAWLDALAANRERSDVPAARAGFRRAIGLDSAFANAYTGLANSYLLSGECAQVDSIGDILEARHSDFAEYDLLYMRAMRATCRGDLDAAFQYRAEALHIAPGNAGALWGAAEAAAAAGRLSEAERLLAGMAGTWYRDEPYYYTLYTATLHLRGKTAEELRVADSARARLRNTAVRFELGARGLAAAGRTADIEARFEEARQSQIRRVPLVELYTNAALELEWHGHAAEARRFATRALEELERATPAERQTPGHRLRQASLLGQLGRWREARAVVDAIDGSRLGAEPGELPAALLLTARGHIAAKAGDRTAARAALTALEQLPESQFAAAKGATREACAAAVLAALGEKGAALRRLADGQARGTIPRSSPGFTHAQPLLRDLWHEPAFEQMFAARD